MKNFFCRLWDRMSDPRLEKPLMIAVPCLTLVLAVLILLPYLRGGALSSPAPAAPEKSLSVLDTPEAGSESASPGSQPAPAESVSYEPIQDEAFLNGILDISEMSPEELPQDTGDAPEETVPELVVLPDDESAAQQIGWQRIGGSEYFFYEDGSCAVGLKQIDGKLYYFNQYGVKARSVGIDVSFYNNDIDWQLVKDQGIDFAIIRVGGRGWSSGKLYDDCRTREYLRGARSAGIKIGVYFYSTAVNPYEAVEEASAALKAVGGIPLDYPVFIDMEFSGEYPEGRADRLTPNERAEIAVAFCETIRNSGCQPGVYAGQNFLKAYVDYYAVSRYTIWLASYTADNRLPFFDRRYDIWQFTDRGWVDGIGDDVDLNVIF